MTESAHRVTNATLVAWLPELRPLGRYLEEHLGPDLELLHDGDPPEFKRLLRGTLVATNPSTFPNPSTSPTIPALNPGTSQDDVSFHV
jgi:hypothetical protein